MTQVAAEPAPAMRAAQTLGDAVRVFRERLDTATLPEPGDPGFLEPPDEQDLAWVRDRSSPFDVRLAAAMQLYDDSKLIMRAYGQRDLSADPEKLRDGAGTVRWATSVVRQISIISSVLLDELVPTLSPADPTYQTRMEGLAQIAHGSFVMLQGGLITLNGRRTDLEERRRLLAAWRDHVGTHARLWSAAQCVHVRIWLDEVSTNETDAVLREGLRAVHAGLTRCQGRL